MYLSVSKQHEASRLVVLLMGLTLLCASAPHFTHLPIWLSLAALLIGGAGMFWGQKVGRWARNGILIGGLLLVLPALYFTYDWNSSDALIGVITFAAWLKIWEVRTRRDVLWLVLASWIIVGFSFVYFQSVFSLLLLFGTSLLALCTILISQDKKRKIPFKQNLLASGRLMAMALPIMVVLFLFFPRVTGSLLDLGFVFGVPMMIETDAEKNQIPLQGSVELGDLAERSKTFNRVLSATFKLQASPYYLKMPPLDMLFWRGPVLWTYDGTTWHERKEFANRGGRMKKRYKRASIDRDLRLSGKIAAYSVRMMPHDGYALYALDVPVSPVPSAFITRDLQLSNLNRVREPLTYEAESYLRYRFEGSLSEEDRALGLQMPEGQNPKLIALAQSWKREASEEKGIVNAAVNYLADGGFTYTSDPVELASNDILDDFLFRAKRGYATHFASAFVQMMRAAGLPARLVTGYKGGAPFDFTETVMVMEQHAYAWAEVWVNDDYGWVRVDVARPLQADTRGGAGASSDAFGLGEATQQTAGNEAETKEKNELVEQQNNPSQSPKTEKAEEDGSLLDFLSASWNEWFLNYDATKQQGLQEKIKLGEANWRSLLLLSVGSVLSLVLSFVGFQFARKVWQKHRYAAQTPLHMRLYREVLIALERGGIEIRGGEGPLKFEERLRGENKISAEAMRVFHKLTHRFMKLHFSKLPESERTRMISEMKQFKVAFLKQLKAQ